MYPIYIDLRKVSTPPASTSTDYKLNATIYFQNILNAIVETIFKDLDFIINPLNQKEIYEANLIKSELSTELNNLGVILNGNKIQKQGDFSINFEKVTNLNGEVGIKRLLGKAGFQKKTVESQDGYSYINFGLIANTMNEIIKILGLQHIIILLDEWSEIDINTQPYLSSLLKSSFVSSSVKIKIGAIKYRTKLLEEVDGSVTYGLEDGGDIFGEDLDNKYVYEINMVNTRAYFSELLYKHLVRFNKSVEGYWSEKIKDH